MESLNLNAEDSKRLRDIADLHFGGNKTKALKYGFNMLVESFDAGALKMSMERKKREVVEAVTKDDPLARVMAIDDTRSISGSALNQIDLDCSAIASFEQSLGTSTVDINQFADLHRQLVVIKTLDQLNAFCKTQRVSQLVVVEEAMNNYGTRWKPCLSVANMCMRQVAKWADLSQQARAANGGMLREDVPE